jgi:hypothetical protein
MIPMQKHDDRHGCGCDHGCDRRDFLAAASTALGGLAFASLTREASGDGDAAPPSKEGARIRATFLYPPSKTFADDPNGWWSWPGNEFDAEGRQKEYTTALRQMEKELGVQLALDPQPTATRADADRLAGELQAKPPDGLLLIMFYNRSLTLADRLIEAAAKAEIPVIFYIGLGVKHGEVTQYRRPGVYFIQSLDNLDAIQYGLRMVQARKLMRQSKLLSITNASEPREGVEPFFGTTVRVIPFSRYADEFSKVSLTGDAREFINKVESGATEIRGITQESLENAARAHFALKKLLAEEQADGLTMNCLKRGMLKPCISFAALNSELIPAACENDFPAMYSQRLGQLLTGRPGFQHNPCYETEKNHYYASHCTCPLHLNGSEEPSMEYLLRRFAHTNEGSCAVQVFWKPGEPVTMMRYHPGKAPALDVYAGKVVKSHPMPPAGGCTTNVAIELTDRSDACMVRGHHNLLFSGDFARKFRLFAQLYKMRLADTGYTGPWPL